MLKETVIDSKMNMSRRRLCISVTTMAKATLFQIYEEKGRGEEINGWKNTFTRMKELSGFIVGGDLVLGAFY